MNEQLKWIMELVDKVSGPAREITKSLKSIEVASLSLGKQIGPRLTQNATSAISSFGDLSRSVGATAAKIGGYVALAGVAAAAWGAKKLGEEAIRASAYKENALISLEVMLKSREAAAKTYKEAEEFASRTPFDTKEVVSLYQKLVTAGFSIEKNAAGISELQGLATVIGDAAAAMGDPAAVGGITKQITQMKNLNKVRMGELNILSEYGISSSKVIDQIAANLGKTHAEVQKLVSTGKIDADTGIKAIMQTIQQTSGGMMAKQAETMTGLWSTLTSRPFEILSTLGEKGELDPLKAAIKFLGEELAPGGALAKGISEFVSWLFIETPKALKAAWAALEPFVDTLGDLWSSLVDVKNQIAASTASMEGLRIVFGVVYVIALLLFNIFSGLVFVIAKLAEGILYAIGVFSILAQKVGGAAVEFYNNALMIGSEIINGIVSGITNGATAIKDAAVGAVDAAYQSVTEYLEIGSPSKLYMDVGKNSALGIARGFTQGAAGVGRAALGAVPQPGALAPSFGAAGFNAPTTTANNQITINVNVSGSAEPDEIKRSTLAALSEAFEDLGWELGVAPQ